MGTHTMQLDEDTELEVQSDGQWVSSELPVPDPKWRGTDSNGHEHHYADGPDRYPTLRKMESEPYWCDLCDDEHTDTWLACRICGEKVTPGTRAPEPVWVAGPTRYYLNGESIGEERAQEIFAEMQRRRDEALQLHERPAIGTQVRFEDAVVTVVPTADSEPLSRVTVMRHGSGAMETLDLDQLRRMR